MTSTDASGVETIGYLACGNNRLSRLEMLQHQQYHQQTVCEHECMHHRHNHSSNFSSPSNVVSNGPYTQFNHLNQHMHPNSYNNHYHQQQQQQGQNQQQQQQSHQDGNLIYNNSSANSECNQPVSPTNDGSQSGCSNMIHYVPTSNISMASQSLNIPNVSCECTGHVQHNHQRQSSEQHSLQSGRSSRIISCDENNPSGTEDGSGMSSSGMITTACRSSRRHLWVWHDFVVVVLYSSFVNFKKNFFLILLGILIYFRKYWNEQHGNNWKSFIKCTR